MDEQQKTSIDALLERSSSTDIPLLLKAKEEAKRIVKDDPSAANLNALDRATKMLRDAMTQATDNGNFTNMKDVLAYLVGGGRKVSQSQLYKDLKSGFLRREKDKSFSKRNVDIYASTLPLVSMPEAESDELQELAKNELSEKVARLREQREDMAFERAVKQKKYILREEVGLELASRAAALDIGLRGVFQLYAPEYVKLVGGDVSKVHELVAEFEKNLDAALSEYSRPMEFRVEYVGEEKSGAVKIGGAPEKESGQEPEDESAD